MAEISFGGLATGLPTEELVTGLMSIERRPLDRLEAEKEYETLRLKAYEQFNDKLDTLRSAAGSLNITSEVRTTSVRMSSEDAVTASSRGASTGSYDIAVAQLAQVQKTVTNGFSSDSEGVLGTGTFFIGGEVITVDNSNNSLQGLMDSINALSEDTGVSASIINDGNKSDNYHLVFTGKDASTGFTVTHTLTGGTALTTDDVRTAQQAKAYVDGIPVVSNTNTLTGVIAGLTVNLNKVSLSTGVPPVIETATLKVESDTESLKEKLSTFVTAYNSVMEWITSGYRDVTGDAEATTDGEKNEEESLSDYLRGDATINDIKRGLQSILSDAVGSSGSLQILSEIGITTQIDGTLLQNNAKMDSALESKFEDVVKLLAGEDSLDGVMKKFNSYLVDATSGADGMYAAKKDRYDNAVKRLDNQIAQKELLIDKIEERIRAQFNAMELLVSSLNNQSAYLTQQMDMLSNLSYGNNR